MFVRKKRVRGREYGYLVKNKWTRQGPRQKVVSYLGSVVSPKRIAATPHEPRFLRDARMEELVNGLVIKELLEHGFKHKDGLLVNTGVSYEPCKYKVRRNGRPVVIQMNEGFLCDATLRQMRQVFMKEEIDGRELAEAILEAGISISPENFVLLYNRLMPER